MPPRISNFYEVLERNCAQADEATLTLPSQGGSKSGEYHLVGVRPPAHMWQVALVPQYYGKSERL